MQKHTNFTENFSEVLQKYKIADQVVLQWHRK